MDFLLVFLFLVFALCHFGRCVGVVLRGRITSSVPLAEENLLTLYFFYVHTKMIPKYEHVFFSNFVSQLMGEKQGGISDLTSTSVENIPKVFYWIFERKLHKLRKFLQKTNYWLFDIYIYFDLRQFIKFA